MPLFSGTRIPDTYSASVVGLVAPATPTDIFVITGSASKLIKISRIMFSGTQSTAAARDVLLILRSTDNTGGTATTRTATPHDSANLAATAVVRAYTANPSALGAAVGTIRATKIQLSDTTAKTPADTLIWEFNYLIPQPIVLRGASQILAVNLNSITSSGNSLDIVVEWTEE